MKFSIDGKEYDMFVISLERKATIKDRKNSTTTLSGEYKRDVAGTYYDYDMEIEFRSSDAKQYDDMYEVITAPQNQPHSVTLRFDCPELERQSSPCSHSRALSLNCIVYS